MLYLFKNMTHSDKICFRINDQDESWLLWFSEELRNEIIKSGENALWDYDANSMIWKMYVENGDHY